MNAAVMTDRIAAASPRLTARISGAFYVLTILARVVADALVRNRLVVPDDAAATAANILAHEPLFRLGFVADLVAFASFAVLTALLYVLFKPVHRSLSLAAAFLSLVACVVQAMSSLFHLAPLVLLGGAPYLSAFPVEQLQALALVFLKLRAAAYHSIGLVFFGWYCLLVGILILRSTFLPRILGVLMALAGLSYVLFLFPPLTRALQSYILVFPAVGQISLALWLVVIGINVPRWEATANARRGGGV